MDRPGVARRAAVLVSMGLTVLHLAVPSLSANFWSIVVYNTQTRSELQAGQPLVSKNNQRDELGVNLGGYVDLYF